MIRTRGSKRAREVLWKCPLADLEEYRSHYPSQPIEREDPMQMDAFFFYSNLAIAAPSHETIDEIHEKWSDDFDRLERTHNYIQWLFPLQEPGLNRLAPQLQKSEIALMRDSAEVMQRVLRSFKMMLRFYGMDMEVLDPQNGIASFRRLISEKVWQERYANLRMHSHNCLRITRILKFLGEMGLEFIKVGWVRFLINEALIEQLLPECGESLEKYWVNTVYDDTMRKELISEISFLMQRNKKINALYCGAE